MTSEWQNRAWRIGLRLAYGLATVYWWVFRPRESSANVALWWNDRILTIQNSYKRLRTVPGGRGRRGEALEETAARELEEEVGITVAPERLEFTGVFVSHVKKKEDRSHFYTIEFRQEPSVTIDRREVIAAEFLTLEEALACDLVDSVRQYLESFATRLPDPGDH